MNGIIPSLESLSRERRLAEKWLVAPNRRIGRQWLDALARRGGCVFNWRLETPVSLAIRLAGPSRTGDARLIPPMLVSRLAQQVLARLRTSGAVTQSPEGYAGALWRTLTQFRLTGITTETLSATGETFWAEALGAYRGVLVQANFFDVADLWRWAAEAVASGEHIATDAHLVVPQSVVSASPPVAQACWEAIPPTLTTRLLDNADVTDDQGRYDHQRLAESAEGCELSFHQAVGATMEIRRVFRECLSRGIALDEVELLYTRTDSYLPTIHEECLRVLGCDDGMTSLEGVPAVFGRPARLIKRLCAWVHAGYDQRGFESMLLDGLLTLPGEVTLFQVAGAVRRLRIGSGRDRWQSRIAAELAAITARLRDPEEQRRERWWQEQREALTAAQQLLDELFEAMAPLEPASVDAAGVFGALEAVLDRLAYCGAQADSLGRQRLMDMFKQLREWHETYPQQRERQGMLDEVAELIEALNVGALGPQPGKLFAAPLAQGGHSGRKHTFIVGMNDHAFPGSVRQDPLLPDTDRVRLNETTGSALALSGQNVSEAIDGFAALLSRLSGAVQISFASHDVVDDRSAYPATILLPLCAARRGETSADLETLYTEAGPAESFLPVDPAAATTETFALLAGPTGDPGRIAAHWPGVHEHLVRGQQASEAWASAEAFTAWDGKLTHGDAARKTFSPSRLETLAGCPRRYFFGYVLGLELPEAADLTPDEWLDPRAYGSLMHDVFCTYYRRVVAEDRWADVQAAREQLLKEIFTEQLAAIEQVCPAPNANARANLMRRAQQSCAILIASDADYLDEQHFRPTHLEVSVGLDPGDDGTSVDRAEPVALTHGLQIRGKIDRIDESTEAPGELRLWDYKTGSTAHYRKSPPFHEGRNLQPYMYYRMAQAIWPEATIRSTGYFFPSDRGLGDRIAYTPEELTGGADLVADLATMIQTGSYPATTHSGDCGICDFKAICGDVDRAAAESEAMLTACDDERLGPLRRLRGMGADDE